MAACGGFAMLEITPNETNGKIGLKYDGSGRLLVLSNRAPIRIVNIGGRRRIEPTVGGVGATFLRLLERQGGVWIAWSGSKSAPAPLRMPPDDPRFSMVFPPLSERDISFYYYGMCNRGLWPLMHLMPQNCHFRAQHWNSYKSVNDLFARITRLSGYRSGSGLDSGFPPRAGAGPVARAPTLAADRAVLACAVSAGVLFPHLSVAAGAA